MAVLRVDPDFLLQRLFPGVPFVHVAEVRLDDRGVLYLTIDGEDVPDSDEVIVITTKTETVRFEALPKKED